MACPFLSVCTGRGLETSYSPMAIMLVLSGLFLPSPPDFFATRPMRKKARAQKDMLASSMMVVVQVKVMNLEPATPVIPILLTTKLIRWAAQVAMP